MPIIALIDADRSERYALHTLLETTSADIELFESAEDFLAHPRAGLLCVVANAHLPGKSGLQLLQQLRANGNDVPVILLSADSDVRTAVEAMRLGATDFIEKTQTDVALMRRIAELMRSRSKPAVKVAVRQ